MSLNKFKNFFLVSEKNLLSYLKFKSQSAICYEKRRQIRTTRCFIIHPYSELNRAWKLWMCIVLLMAVIIFPFTSSFLGPYYVKSAVTVESTLLRFQMLLSTVFIIRIFCLMDIVVTFFTGYINSSTDEMVIQPSRIARHYISTYFFPDLISSVPIDFIYICVYGMKSYSEVNKLLHFAFSIMPLLKLIRIGTLYNCLYNLYGSFFSSYSIYKTVAAIVFYFLLIHWGACLHFLVPRLIYYHELLNCHKGRCRYSWLTISRLTKKTLFKQYATGAYKTLTCFARLGNENITLINMEDKVLSILLGFVGIIYWMLLLIVSIKMYSTITLGKASYLEIIDQVRHYMNLKKFPPNLRRRIEIYYTYMFRKDFVPEQRILQFLSENLRQETILKMHQNLVEKVYMFSSLNETLIYEIIRCLKREIYLTGDYFYKFGEIGTCMYFISFGTVAIYTEKGKEIGHLEDGEYFGELSVLFNVRRPVTVVAIETTEAFSFQNDDFMKIIKPNVKIYARMEKIGLERIKKSRNVSSNTHTSWKLKSNESKHSKVVNSYIDDDDNNEKSE